MGLPSFDPRPPRWPADAPLHQRLLRALVLGFALGSTTPAEPPVPAPKSPVPFLHLRETTLGYHGPDEDLVELTEYRIGWFGPSDTTNQTGADLWWAANLAVQEANAARTERLSPSLEATPPQSAIQNPKSKIPFRLIPRWAADPWGSGVAQLARMVYEEKPVALLGSIDSASTHLAEQIVAKANLPLVSPVATDPSITLAGVSWMFSCAPSDAAIARALVDDVLSAMGDADGPLAMLTATDHESRMTAREVLREFSRRQHPPDFRFNLPSGAPSIVRQLEAIAHARPTALVIIAGAEDSARLVRALRHPAPPAVSTDQQAAVPRLFGGPSMARSRFGELSGSAGEGVRFPLLARLEPADPRAARFAARFTAAHQRPPDYAAILTYDATCLLIEAVLEAGPNRNRVRQELIRLSPWPGIGGPIRFDGTGQNTRTDVPMANWRNGRLDPADHAPSSRPAPQTRILP
ncbi:MAG: ABC transporter substrate-binding protein [Limisphaerales bacterium]